jgi:signal peptidase I
MNFLSRLERGFVWFFDVGRVVILIAIAVVVFYYSTGQFFVVSGISMDSSLTDGEWLAISKINHYLRDIKRGEVVVFHFPGTRDDKYIKRIIGLPGEKVEVKNGSVFINNIKLHEGYLDKGETTEGKVEMHLEEGEYFVLGDNRDQSNDSRAWGSLPKEEIIGQAVFVVYPFKNRRSIIVPGYYFKNLQF